MKSAKRIFKAMCFVLLAMTMSAAAAHAAVAEYLAKMPAQSTADGDALCAEFLKMGAGAVTELCGLLKTQGTGDDTAARYLLTGLVKYVSRLPQMEAERKLVAEAMAAAVPAAADNEIKAFLLQHLQLIGRDEIVAPLAPLLADETLCRPAAQTLAASGCPQAEQALATAIPGATGIRLATLTAALGDMKAKTATAVLAPLATNEDAAVRSAALYALARSGAPEAGEALAKAVEAAPTPVAKLSACDCLITYAQARAAAGDKTECETICRKILAGGLPVSAQSAALATLVDVNGPRALPDLLAAADSPNRELCGAAMRHAAALQSKQTTKEFAAKIATAGPDLKIAILEMLARRADAAALPAVAAAMEDPELYVRLAAMDAAPRVGGPKAFPALLKALKKAENPEEIKAASEALLQVTGEKQFAALASALPKAPPAARKALFEIAAARRAEPCREVAFKQASAKDDDVRVAALKALKDLAGPDDAPRLVGLLLKAKAEQEMTAANDTLVAVAGQIEDPEQRAAALLAALENAGDKRPALLKALSGIGGTAALQVIVADTKAADATLKDAAIRALANWPTADAAPELLAIAKDGADEILQVVALRGYVRMATLDSVNADAKVQMYTDALAAAKRPEEKTLVLGNLGAVRTPQALALAGSCIDNPELQAQAALAAYKIACPQNDNDTGLTGPGVADILKKVEPLLPNDEMKQRVQVYVATLPGPDPEGFVSLFNGADLTGWVGDTKGYVVENGAIVCKPGGNLFTQAEYKDFDLRFEFKLTPNANNGLGIRAPLEGNAAYVGMELQVLDDSGSDYTTLKPYQYHGSVYGIAPCIRGHQKPVGEWNTQQVIAQGRRVKVLLNDTVIVDVDLDQAVANGTMDGQEHPGLKNEKGHIGFLGHGSVVEFRNLRIKEL